jgi:hypothetical protein
MTLLRSLSRRTNGALLGVATLTLITCGIGHIEKLPAQPVYEHFARAELVSFDGDAPGSSQVGGVPLSDDFRLHTLLFGRVIEVAPAEPTKTFFTRHCLSAVTGKEEEVSWVRVRFQVDGVVVDEYGDAIDDEVIDLVTLHKDGTSPLETLSAAHDWIGIRVPRASEWDADLPPLPEGSLEPPGTVPEGHERELECARQSAIDLHAHPNEGFRVFRGFDVNGTLGNPMTVDGHPDEVGRIPPRDMKYSITSDEVCALSYLRTNGTANPIRSYAKKWLSSTDDPTTIDWCWPREEVECFTAWRGRAVGAATEFDCSSLGPLEVSTPLDAGAPSDGGG